tara:strand:+ start:719 stop:3025 length:2307 start_codon:yes stop_codon:yes gene_type:complete
MKQHEFVMKKIYELRPRKYINGQLKYRNNPYYNFRTTNYINYSDNINNGYNMNDKKLFKDISRVCSIFNKRHFSKKRKISQVLIEIDNEINFNLDDYDIKLDNYEIESRKRLISIDRGEYRRIDDNEIIIDSWDKFNTYSLIDNGTNNPQKDWVSPSNIKNYLLWDPLLDWLHLYYLDKGFNDNEQVCLNNNLNYKLKKDKPIESESNSMQILCEMGNRFEYNVIKFLKNKYTGNIRTVSKSYNDINQSVAKKTIEYMKLGVPIIDQAVLYNHTNRTFGVADLLIRSDWVNQIFNSNPLSDDLINIKGDKLNGNYHYIVIDIKWTTLNLCANGELIRNSDRFPSYKSQLAIYNAAVGQIQGYTPDKAYILAKSYKYTSKGVSFVGYNCFDLLGHVDFSDFDREYLDRTYKAINWIRNLRYNGHEWSCLPPSVPELYPNMSNRFDAPYHHVKKDLAERLNELTQIWMVGPKNRFFAHNKGIYKWTDQKCNSLNLNIKGKKRQKVVNKILEINNPNNNNNILPLKIDNNDYDWKNSHELDFYIDFEILNCCFIDRKINLNDSKDITGMLFLIGVGYEENNEWKYKKFLMKEITLDEEKKNVTDFINFIENKVKLLMDNHNIADRKLCTPKFYFWSKAERSFMKNTNKRHNQIFTNWINNNIWIDFCEIFQKEPITIKGVTNFKLKNVANKMAEYKFINPCWESDSPIGGGLKAMMEAVNYYKYMKNNNREDDIFTFESKNKIMNDIIRYNEGDCKSVYEIINFFRKYDNH